MAEPDLPSAPIEKRDVGGTCRSTVFVPLADPWLGRDEAPAAFRVQHERIGPAGPRRAL